MFFKLKGAKHTQDGREYRNGDVIETGVNLCNKFRGKFTRLQGGGFEDTGSDVEIEQPNIAMSTDNDSPTNESESVDDVVEDEEEVDEEVDYDEDEDEDEDEDDDEDDEDEDEAARIAAVAKEKKAKKAKKDKAKKSKKDKKAKKGKK